jgi:hypothetical protein
MACKRIRINIVHMERMIGGWGLFVRDDTNFFAVGICRTRSDYADQSFWIFESPWVTNLLNLIAYLEDSDVRRLSPNDQSASHELNSHDLALTLWELERLFFDSLQCDLIKSKISCDEKRFFVSKKAF